MDYRVAALAGCVQCSWRVRRSEDDPRSRRVFARVDEFIHVQDRLRRWVQPQS